MVPDFRLSHVLHIKDVCAHPPCETRLFNLIPTDFATMSGKETFESALKLSKTNANSQFVSISSRKHVKLSPKYLGNVKSGVAEQLDSQVSFFSEE